MSILTRLLVALGAVALIPLAILGWRLVNLNRDEMRKQVQRTHIVAVNAAAERIASHLRTRQGTAASLARNPILTGDPKSESGQALLHGMLESDPDIQVIDVATPAGESVVRAQLRDAGPHVAETLAIPPNIFPKIWRSGERFFLLTTSPLEEGRGFVRVVSDASAAMNALQAVAVEDEAEMVLAARDGERILGVAPTAPFPAIMTRQAMSTQVTGAGLYEDHEGRQIVGAYAPVPNSPWVVLSRQPAQLAESIALRLRRDSLIAIGFAVLLGVLIAWGAWHSFVRPVRSLIDAQARLAGSAGPTSGNELDRLRETFAKLERRINDQEQLGEVFLGRYQILSILGQGGMGTVFRGWDPKLQRRIALKTLRFTRIKEGDASAMVASLLKEAVTIASLNHPHIVAIYDVEDSPDGAYFAMELVEGTTLLGYLRKKRRLAPGQATLVGLAVARALVAAHSRKVLHHDIKPANVLLGVDGSIKVTDFGISDLMTSMHKTTRLVFGTPGYISPEAAVGRVPDQRGDLFSLGVLLYESLTAQSPFQRSDVRTTLTATVHVQPPSIASIVKSEELDPELTTLIERLMAKKPGDRPADAEEVVDALNAIATRRGFQWNFEMPAGPPARDLGTTHVAAMVSTISVEEKDVA